MNFVSITTLSMLTYHLLMFQCAYCHGVTNILPWLITISCQHHEDPERAPYPVSINSSDTLKTIWSNFNCNAGFQHPSTKQPSPAQVPVPVECAPRVTDCPAGCQHNVLSARCAKSKQLLVSSVHTKVVFRNTFCALCNGAYPQYLQCGVPMPIPVTTTYRETDSIGYFIALLTLQSSPSRGVYIDEETTPCVQGNSRHSRDRKCRSSSPCPQGFVQEEGICVIHNENVIINVTIVSTVKAINEEDNDAFVDFIASEKYAQNLNKLISEIQHEHSLHTHVAPTADVVISKTSPRITQIKVISYADLYMHDQTDPAAFINQFVANLMGVVNTDLLSYIGETKSRIISLRTISKGHDVTSWSIGGDHCQWQNHDQNEVVIFNDRVDILASNLKYSKYKIHPREPKVIVCVNTTTPVQRLLSSTDVTSTLLYYVIITVFLASLSLLVLRIGLIIFLCRFNQAKSWPYLSVTQRHLAASIVITHMVFLVTNLIDISNIHDACVVLSGIRHCTLLVALTSLCHMINQIRVAKDYKSDVNVGQSGWATFVIVWGIPIVFSTALISLSYFGHIDRSVNSIFTFSFCWFTDSKYIWTLLVVPFITLAVILLILTILARRNLNRLKKKRAELETSEYNLKFDFVVICNFVFLVILSRSMVLWSLFHRSVIGWTIFSLLEACQGVYLFVTSLCRKPDHRCCASGNFNTTSRTM